MAMVSYNIPNLTTAASLLVPPMTASVPGLNDPKLSTWVSEGPKSILSRLHEGERRSLSYGNSNVSKCTVYHINVHLASSFNVVEKKQASMKHDVYTEKPARRKKIVC